MANPNIVSVTSIKGESLGYNLTNTTTTTLLTVSADKVLKVNRIMSQTSMGRMQQLLIYQ